MLLKTMIVLLCMQFAVGQSYTYVTTDSGRIRGRLRYMEIDEENSAYNSAFFGIPYAKPPVGDLRFRRPVSPDPWEGTLDAERMPPACPQYSKYPFPWHDSEPGQSEDCLYLNVWAPANVSRLSPVKLYIHGDDRFTQGSIRMGYYRGQDDALDILEPREAALKSYPEYLGIVVVTINYRLGALGFFTSDTSDAPGNVGLYDMVMSMEWVQKNIAAFGGDPDRVTLVGQGSGAIAASLFCFSPLSFDLFRGLILTGGSFLSIRGDSHEGNLRLGQQLADAVGCDSSLRDDPGDTVNCLRGVDATRLVQVLGSFDPTSPTPAFLPQYERDDLFPANPEWMLKNKYFQEKAIVIGFTEDEGSCLLTTSHPEEFGVFGEKDVGVNATFAKFVLSRFLKDYPEGVVDDLVKDFDEDATRENRGKLYKAMGDERVVCPIVYLAESFADAGAQVYMFERQIRPPYNPWADWMGSVHFNDVQNDFVRYDGPLIVNGMAYNFTQTQRSFTFLTKVDHARFMYTGESPSSKFTRENRVYSYESQDAEKLDKVVKTDPGGRNCEVFRPYFLSDD